MKTQRDYFYAAHGNLARGNETALDLLFGSNPISDDELRALIAKRPALWQRFAVYLGRRPTKQGELIKP